MSDKKPTPSTAPDISILGNDVTLHPAGYTESDAPKKRYEDNTRTLIDSFARFRQNPIDFFREISLHINGTGWRAYDDIIGAPVYYPGFVEDMKGRVMKSPMLLSKIAELSRRRVEVETDQGILINEEKQERRRRELETSLREVVDDQLENMICKLEPKRFIRSAYYLATQLLTRTYHQGIHVSSEEVLRLKAVAAKAAKKKQSVIFLPSHRSHIDYISMQIICYRLGMTLPTVVAGDNLNFPLVGPFMQHAGAMWIRRSFGNDQLYSTTVQAYIDTLLQNGYTFECFIEGGRSRTGKLLGPKFGILRFILDSLLSGRVEDAIICPVSCQYDKVIEVNSYISELLGQPKQKENLADFLSASSLLSLKLGRIDVRFHEPWSLREFVNQQFERYTDLPAQVSSSESWSDERRLRLLRTLGYKVLSDINNVSVVMPTALVGTVILTLRGRGVGKAELIRRVEWLCDRVHDKGGRVAHFANLPTEVVVERALEVLGPALVGKVSNLPEDTYYAVDRFQLSFYRNMTIHLFILESLVCAGLYTRVKLSAGPEHHSMTYTELRNQVEFLSQLFRGEFIFPTDGLDTNMHRALAHLKSDNVLEITKDSEDPESIISVQLSDAERDRGRENFDFYCFLIWPFIEASWLGAVSLLMLTPPAGFEGERWIDAKASQDTAQLLGKTLYHQGDLSYFEAVNKETLKNAYQRFGEEGMIEARQSRDKKESQQIRLADDWVPTRDATGRVAGHGKLWEFAEAVSQSRREGKNRRDGRTVQKRVLGLVEVVGAELWDSVVSMDGAEGSLPAKAKQRRRKAIQPASRL